MATRISTQDTTLQIRRTFAAPREQVFNAWTDPKALIRWFAPSDDFSTPSVAVDLRVGGSYQIVMKAPAGEVHAVKGTYREIKIPEKLVFTWVWEEGGCGGESISEDHPTVVTVEFHDRGSMTEVVLTHEFLPSLEAKEKHAEGWTGCLNRLQAKLF